MSFKATSFKVTGLRRKGFTPPVVWWKPWTWYAREQGGEWEEYEKVVYTEEYIKEQLAILCHDQWAGWMEYLFTKGKLNGNGTFTIRAESVGRWHGQMRTAYSELSETEQQSDLNEAQKFIDFLATLGINISKTLEIVLE